MSFTDPIGDMLTRIRNSSMARHEKVAIPFSKLKQRIAEVLRDEGYIKDFLLHRSEETGHNAISLLLKYDDQNKPVIHFVKRASRPGLRRYVGHDSVPRVLNGLGIAILSTSGGLMVDREARKRKLGGELICTVW